MPPRIWSRKRERQYEHIKEGLEDRGRSEDVAEEIAARTVNKEKARSCESKSSSRSSKRGASASSRGGKQSGKGPAGRTREQLYNDAKIIKDKGLLATPIAWSWAQAEAAICDYTTLVSAYGGDFLKDGKPDFQNGGGLDALKYMVDSYKSGLTNPNSKEFLEEDVRKVFENGDAAFALNWTYMYNMANDPKDSKVAGKVGVVPAPGVAGKSEVSLDLATLFSDTDLDAVEPASDPVVGCMSSTADPECPPLYAKLGMGFEGAPSPGPQTLFQVKAP